MLKKVPPSWTKLAYASLNGLSAWYADLLLRIKVIMLWAPDDFKVLTTLNFCQRNWKDGLPTSTFPLLFGSQDSSTPSRSWRQLCKARRERTSCPWTRCASPARWRRSRRGRCSRTRRRELTRTVSSWKAPVGTLRRVTSQRATWRSCTQACRWCTSRPLPRTSRRRGTSTSARCTRLVKEVWSLESYIFLFPPGPTYIWTFNLKTKERSSKWVLAGVALLLQIWFPSAVNEMKAKCYVRKLEVE